MSSAKPHGGPRSGDPTVTTMDPHHFTVHDVRAWLAVRNRFRLRATRASLFLIAMAWLTMGLGHLIGADAWRSSPSYTVIRLWVPLRAWGVVFVIIGLVDLVATFHNSKAWTLGIIVGAGVATCWGASFVAAALIHQLTGAGWPLWFYFGFSQVMLSGYQIHRDR